MSWVKRPVSEAIEITNDPPGDFSRIQSAHYTESSRAFDTPLRARWSDFLLLSCMDNLGKPPHTEQSLWVLHDVYYSHSMKSRENRCVS